MEKHTYARDNLQLTGRALGRVLNFRGGCMHTMHFLPSVAIQPNLELKIQPKQLLGSLLLVIALPAYTIWYFLSRECILKYQTLSLIDNSLVYQFFKTTLVRTLFRITVKRTLGRSLWRIKPHMTTLGRATFSKIAMLRTHSTTKASRRSITKFSITTLHRTALAFQNNTEKDNT